jgi:hypothetical protein
MGDGEMEDKHEKYMAIAIDQVQWPSYDLLTLLVRQRKLWMRMKCPSAVCLWKGIQAGSSAKVAT